MVIGRLLFFSKCSPFRGHVSFLGYNFICISAVLQWGMQSLRLIQTMIWPLPFGPSPTWRVPNQQDVFLLKNWLMLLASSQPLLLKGYQWHCGPARRSLHRWTFQKTKSWRRCCLRSSLPQTASIPKVLPIYFGHWQPWMLTQERSSQIQRRTQKQDVLFHASKITLPWSCLIVVLQLFTFETCYPTMLGHKIRCPKSRLKVWIIEEQIGYWLISITTETTSRRKRVLLQQKQARLGRCTS